MQMKMIFIAIFAFVAVTRASILPAPTLIRTPHLDSAIIRSDQIGGGFAYSTLEGLAYQGVSPVVTKVLPWQYRYQFNPFPFTYPSSQQVILGESLLGESPISPVHQIEVPTQPAKPAEFAPSDSQSSSVDSDSVTIEAA